MFIAADLFFTPIVVEHATVIDKRDHWSIKYGHQCETRLQTVTGVADNYSFGTCAQMPWEPGQSMDVHVRKGRLTRWVAVYGGGLELERGAAVALSHAP